MKTEGLKDQRTFGQMTRVKKPEELRTTELPEGLQIIQDEDRGFKDQRQGKK
jgi:hypothetical protein